MEWEPGMQWLGGLQRVTRIPYRIPGGAQGSAGRVVCKMLALLESEGLVNLHHGDA